MQNEDQLIVSKRRFLKQMGYGALLALSGSQSALAAARHMSSTPHPKKAPIHTHTASKSHLSPPKARVRSVLHTHPIHHPNPHAIRSSLSEPHTPLAYLSHKTIALHNINTGDKLHLTYFERGRYIDEALQEINYLFRDYHNGAVHPIDPLLLDQLYEINRHLDINKPFHVISGYRSPLTNALMHEQRAGVAKHSLHMEGRAIDIRVEGPQLSAIRNVALAMQRGGVGYYPSGNFVHIDTGDVRTW